MKKIIFALFLLTFSLSFSNSVLENPRIKEKLK